MQNHYNLVYREEEREMLPLCRAEKVGVIPWSPLARGFLAGTRRPGGGGDTTRSRSDDFAAKMYFKETDFQVAARVQDLAKRRGVSPAQVALAWLLHQPGLTAPIIGASKMVHLEEAVKALDLPLSAEETRWLEELYQPHPVLGHS
jgi:aryl-alcohol dehydrogenase (NADP+)